VAGGNNAGRPGIPTPTALGILREIDARVGVKSRQ
jgi:hypothetical protein